MSLVFKRKQHTIMIFLNPNHHIPPTNPTHDLNISPVIGELFAATLSMMNAQVLTQTNGCNKYVCKYIGTSWSGHI